MMDSMTEDDFVDAAVADDDVDLDSSLLSEEDEQQLCCCWVVEVDSNLMTQQQVCCCFEVDYYSLHLRAVDSN